MISLMAPKKGFKHSLEARKRISDALRKRVRKPVTEETKKKMSASLKGRMAWNKGLPMTWVPGRMTGKIPWNKGLKNAYTTSKKGKKQPHVSGDKHWAWKGGVTPENRALRNSLDTKLWREAVFARDNFTCVFCGAHGGWLEADHIKRWKDFPELRHDVGNGRTLCRPCHVTTFKVC